MPNLDMQSIELTGAGAAVAGSVAASLANRGPDSPSRKVADTVAGAMVGIVCGPGVADLVGAANGHVFALACFGTGAAGVILLTLFLDWIKGLSVKDWLARWK